MKGRRYVLALTVACDWGHSRPWSKGENDVMIITSAVSSSSNFVQRPTEEVRSASDPAQDLLLTGRNPLEAFFKPASIALIGATEREGSVGRTVLENLLQGPATTQVYPINPERQSVLGAAAFPNIAAVPKAVDLAIVVTPAKTVPKVIGECVDAGVKAAVVISAGFRELGLQGAELEAQIGRHLTRGHMRLIGPNCLGILNPYAGLNATFVRTIPRRGNIALLSQSGALLSALFDWSMREMVGFSACVSTGSMLDVGWGDLIYYFGDDPNTSAILLYMESVGDARSFVSAAREVALKKPIIVIKAGRSKAAAQAAASHTGALTGSDEVLEAAFRRCGVLRVNSIGELFNMAEVLGKQPRPTGPRLTIITNAGGPAVLATDALVAGGGEPAALSQNTWEALNSFLPPHWSRGNPVDILGDAGPERYARVLEIAAKDPNSDGLLVIMTLQGMTDPVATAEILKPYAKGLGKPVLASWMGGLGVAAGEAVLNAAGIPTFAFPDTAARAFNYLWRYAYNLRGLYETPTLSEVEVDSDARLEVIDLINRARGSGRTLLTEAESKRVLSLYGIPAVATRVGSSEPEAVSLAREIGFPVVLKLHSETITHKAEVGGVKLNLADEEAVRHAYREIQQSVSERAGAQHFLGVSVQPMIRPEGYELIVGSTLDEQFGPVVLFGAGGRMVEVFQDRALALPPLNTTLARRLMEQTRIFKALQRGRTAVELAPLEELLVRFSQLVIEQRWIKEIDINPLLATSDGLLALDARVVLHGGKVREDDLPRGVIRPYPAQYVSPWTMKDGMDVVIRPIRPEDEPLMAKFHQTLSERTVYLRYFQFSPLSQRTAHERLVRICFIDYDREMALVAERRKPNGDREIIGVGRLTKVHGHNEAEVAVLISDRYQHRGLGTELLKRLVHIGRDEQLDRLVAYMLPENQEILKMCLRLGFKARHEAGESLLTAILEL